MSARSADDGKNARSILLDVVTDKYFRTAYQSLRDMHEAGDDKDAHTAQVVGIGRARRQQDIALDRYRNAKPFGDWKWNDDEFAPLAPKIQAAIKSMVAAGMGVHGDITSITFEPGTAFTITAGLMNLLLVVDAFDIAQGRKE